MNIDKYTALMLEPDYRFILRYRDALNLSGWFDAKAVKSISKFILEARNAEYDIFVIDIDMDDEDGIFEPEEILGGIRTGVALFHHLRDIRPDSKVVAFTNSTLPEMLNWFDTDDSVDYMLKYDYRDEQLFTRDLYECVLKYYDFERYIDFVSKRRVDIDGVLLKAYANFNTGDIETALAQSRTALDMTLKKLCSEFGLDGANQMKDLNLRLYKRQVYDLTTMEMIKRWTFAGNYPVHGEFGRYNTNEIKSILDGIKDFVAKHINYSGQKT